VRSYLSLSNHQCYRRLLAQFLGKRDQNGKKVLFDLQDVRIDNVGGRYFYHIVHDFIAAGYTPYYRDRFRFLANMETKGYKKHLLEFPFFIFREATDLIDGSEEEVILLSDCPKVIESSKTPRKVLIDYSMLRANLSNNEVPLNFSMSPAILRKKLPIPEVDIKAKRPIKFLFAGNLDPKVYGKSTMPDKHGMMNRIQVIEAIKSMAGEGDLVCPEEQLSFEEITKERNIVILDTRTCKVPQEQWLEFLSKADFFIAAPGEGMPLCHNVVEAIAVGAVPILSYGEYLGEGLNTDNSVFFSEEKSLLEALKELDQPSIYRKELQRFYRDNLEASVLAKKLAQQDEEEEEDEVNAVLVLNDYRYSRSLDNLASKVE